MLGRPGRNFVGLLVVATWIHGDQCLDIHLLGIDEHQVVILIGACLLSEILEVLLHHAVVRALLETEVPTIVQVLLELVGEAFAQLRQRKALLGVSDFLELFLLRSGLEAGPRQGPPEEVDQHVADGLQVVPSALRCAPVGVHGSIPRGAGQRVRSGHGDVPPVPILYAQAEVDEVKVVHLAPGPPHEVVRLDVPVHNALRVQVLDPVEGLFRYQRRGGSG
mmetsp:Transcript_166320/g.534142  ORF Transcript_166320/g.534142 Transcript_166320/m.534142 type:complete len:221 (+) Transcript_166320:175-837(+)